MEDLGEAPHPNWGRGSALESDLPAGFAGTELPGVSLDPLEVGRVPG